MMYMCIVSMPVCCCTNKFCKRQPISISKSKKKQGFFVVKLLGISFVRVIYFWLFVAASYPIHRYVFIDHEQKEKKIILNEVLKISTQIALLMVIAYLIRNVVDRTHFSLHGSNDVNTILSRYNHDHVSPYGMVTLTKAFLMPNGNAGNCSTTPPSMSLSVALCCYHRALTQYCSLAVPCSCRVLGLGKWLSWPIRGILCVTRKSKTNWLQNLRIMTSIVQCGRQVLIFLNPPTAYSAVSET